MDKEKRHEELDDEIEDIIDVLPDDIPHSADTRTVLAQVRTIQAAERTFAAWIRTGFSMASAGWALIQVLYNFYDSMISVAIGGGLILLGIICFFYGWYSFRAVYAYTNTLINEIHQLDAPELGFTMMMVSFITFFLAFLFVIAFVYAVT